MTPNVPERAEIEAVCRAWWPMWPKSPNPEGERQRAREAIEALDRVRDARGDDEARKTLDALAYRVYYGDDEEAREIARQWREAARPPQDVRCICGRCGHGACVRPKGHTGSHSVRLDDTPFSVPQSSPYPWPYPWLTIYPDGHMEGDMIGTTAVEADRRLVIMQELQAGRLKIAGGLGQ